MKATPLFPLLLALGASLLTAGCASYVNSPAVARSLKEKSAAFSDPLIAQAANARPAMHFPATIALAPHDRAVRDHLRALSARGTLDTLTAQPQLARTVIVSPVIVGETDQQRRITADLRLREAAAKLHADAVLIFAVETQATDGRIIAPLTELSLGLLPNKRYEIIATAFAALVDTHTGYLYGTDEKSCVRSGLTMAWGGDEVTSRARTKVEREAVEKLFAGFPAFWRGVLAAHRR